MAVRVASRPGRRGLHLHDRRRHGPPRPPVRLAARRRDGAEPDRRPQRFRLDRRRIPGPPALVGPDLRAAHRHVHPRGDVRLGDREVGAPQGARRDARRVDAGQRLPRRLRLGLRRRLPLRPPPGIRRARRVEAAGRRLPRPQARRDPRRRVQPHGAVGQLPAEVRPLLHRPPPHPLGQRAQLRRPVQRRGPPVLLRQRPDVVPRLPLRRPPPRRRARHRRHQRHPLPGAAQHARWKSSRPTSAATSS